MPAQIQLWNKNSKRAIIIDRSNIFLEQCLIVKLFSPGAYTSHLHNNKFPMKTTREIRKSSSQLKTNVMSTTHVLETFISSY